MSPIMHSYMHDTKIVRIPIDTKKALDAAKPPGIELWKFTADVIALGLSVREKLKGNKDLQSITEYEMADLLRDPVNVMLSKGVEKSRA